MFKVNHFTLDPTFCFPSMFPLPHISSIFKFFSQINMCKCFPYFKKVSPTLSPSQATLFLCFSLIPLLPHLPSSIPHLAFDLSTLLEIKAAGVSFKGYTRGLLILRSQGFSSPVRTCFLSSSLFLSIWKLQTAGLRYSPHKTYSRSGQKPLALGGGGGAGLLYGKP